MDLFSEIHTDTEVMKVQKDKSAEESFDLVTEAMNPQDNKNGILVMLEDLIELIRNVYMHCITVWRYEQGSSQIKGYEKGTFIAGETEIGNDH